MGRRLVFREWWLTLALTGLCLGLAALVVWEWQAQPGLQAGATASHAEGAPRTGDAVLPQFEAGVPPLGEFAAISERPLFSETRRPPDPEPEPVIGATTAPPPPLAPLPDLKLVGVAITDDMRAALVWDQRNKVFKRLEEGHSEAGWDVTQVGPEAVLLSRGSVQREIKLPKF